MRPLATLLTLLTLFIVPTVAATSAPSGSPSGLRLNEVLPGPARDWDGSGAFSSRDDEWVEVVNQGPGTIGLAGYFLSDADSIPRYAFTGTLPEHERFVVYGKTSYDWERANGFPAFGLSLSNSGDDVLLWHVTGAETTLVDSYRYRSHEAAADRSIGRIGDVGDWTLFDGYNPYTGTLPPLGSGCPPTLDGRNACGVTPARAVSWGKVKLIYR
jgi:hypothetical protein